MDRQEWQEAYNRYIEELARNTLEQKPVNQHLLNWINEAQTHMRDMDIANAMKRIKENTPVNDSSELLEDFDTIHR